MNERNLPFELFSQPKWMHMIPRRYLNAACTGLLWLISVAFLTPPALAQTEATDAPPKPAAHEQLVSIDFNNVDIGVFIKFISDLTKKNFVIDDRVKGKVTIISPGKITVAEAYKVFESVLEVQGFAAVPAGEIIKIVSSPDARTKNIKTRLEEESGVTGDSVVTQIIPLRYADPEEIKRLFTPLVSKSSVILSYSPTNTMIITDVQSNINRLLRILKAIDITGVGQQIAIIPVEYADAAKLVNILNSVFKTTQKGKVAPQKDITFVADERTNVIVVLASEADTESIRQLVRNLDKETPKGQAKIHVYYLEHATAEDLAKVLQDIPQQTGAAEKGGKPTAPVVSDKVRITADKATNSLIIMADLEDYLVLEGIIRKIDIPRAMVYIEALIMEVNVNKDFRLGTEWLFGGETGYDGMDGAYAAGFGGGALGGDSGYAYTGAVNMAAGNTVSSLAPGFSLGLFGESITIGDLTLPTISAIVQAYKKDKDVQILSTPQILTTDNQEAKISVGKNVPFQTQATVSSAASGEVYNSYEYRDVGKTLKITPHISKDRMVRLELSLEVSDLESTTENRPTTLKRTVETTAIVRDHHTIVLGGLIDDNISSTNYKVPCLGDVPGLGWMFRSMAKSNTKTNLYVFLTPRVIQNSKEATDVSVKKRNEIDNVQSGEIKLYPKDSSRPAEIMPAPQSDRDMDGEKQESLSDTGSEETSIGTVSSESPTMIQGMDSEGSAAVVPEKTKPAVPSVPAPPEDVAAQQAESGLNSKPPNPEEKSSASNVSDGTKNPDNIGYTIQVISVNSIEAAGDALSSLTKQGFAAYTVRAEVAGETWYRLRIGYFETPAAAAEILAKLRVNQYDPILIKL
jgi:general secretion pathway protein D